MVMVLRGLPSSSTTEDLSSSDLVNESAELGIGFYIVKENPTGSANESRVPSECKLAWSLLLYYCILLLLYTTGCR